MIPGYLDVAGLGPWLSLIFLLLISIAAGTIGSMLGLGGGIVLVPALVLLFDVDIHLAIAASLVSVIATSSGAAATLVEDGLTDLRLAMFLETATVVGGVVGAAIAVTLLASRGDVLVLAFVPLVILGAVLMLLRRSDDVRASAPADGLAERLKLSGEYYDERRQANVAYRVSQTRTGLAFSGIAGLASGMLGIGGGIFYVPSMNSFMSVPLRVAGATSMLMVGVTAVAGALVFLFAGDVVLPLTAPVALGVLAGSAIGIRLQSGASIPWLKGVFAVVLSAAALSMVLRGVGVLP